jgi:hypothetical protein
MSSDRSQVARRTVEQGLRRGLSDLGPGPDAHVPYLRIRLPEGADADAVARAVQTSLGRTMARGGSAQGVKQTGEAAS